MAIRRDITVTRKGISNPINIVHETNLIPFEFVIVDFAIPTGAMAVAYVEVSDGELRKQLCDIANNVISFTPEATLFDEGKNTLQLRVTYEEKNLFSFCELVNCIGKIVNDDAKEIESQPTLVEQLLTEVGKVQANAAEAKQKAEDVENLLPEHDLTDNIVTFDSYDCADEYEGTYVIESIKSGEKLKEILAKLTKFTNNIRWMLDFMAPKKIQEVGYTSIADAVEPKIFKASATKKSTFAHNEQYGLTIVKLVSSSISEGNHGLALTDDGQIEVVEDIKYIRVYAAANVSSSGCYFAVLYNEGYSYTPLIPLAFNNVEGYEATCSYLLSVKKGDKIGIGIGKSTVIETTLSFATMIIEVIK